jgi:hypothetical protein
MVVNISDLLRYTLWSCWFFHFIGFSCVSYVIFFSCLVMGVFLCPLWKKGEKCFENEYVLLLLWVIWGGIVCFSYISYCGCGLQTIFFLVWLLFLYLPKLLLYCICLKTHIWIEKVVLVKVSICLMSLLLSPQNWNIAHSINRGPVVVC